MHFSVSCGSFLCVMLLLFLPAPGELQCPTTDTHNNVPVYPRCCVKISKAYIREIVCSCFIQQRETFSHCQANAYIFVTPSNQFCVDPSASWLRGRLKRMEKRGIFCKDL